jgi:hypothetical protein
MTERRTGRKLHERQNDPSEQATEVRNGFRHKAIRREKQSFGAPPGAPDVYSIRHRTGVWR